MPIVCSMPMSLVWIDWPEMNPTQCFGKMDSAMFAL